MKIYTECTYFIGKLTTVGFFSTKNMFFVNLCKENLKKNIKDIVNGRPTVYDIVIKLKVGNLLMY